MADNITEILALLVEQMRAADRDREDNMRRFERLTEVMIDGFGRLEDKLDGVKQRVDVLTDEQRTLNRRLPPPLTRPASSRSRPPILTCA